MKSICIPILLMGTGLPAIADQPSMPDLKTIKREAARQAGSDKFEVGTPIMISKDQFALEVLVGTKKCTLYLQPSKKGATSGRWEIARMLCDN